MESIPESGDDSGHCCLHSPIHVPGNLGFDSDQTHWSKYIKMKKQWHVVWFEISFIWIKQQDLISQFLNEVSGMIRLFHPMKWIRMIHKFRYINMKNQWDVAWFDISFR